MVRPSWAAEEAYGGSGGGGAREGHAGACGCALRVEKRGKAVGTVDISASRSAVTFGRRQGAADEVLKHTSISRAHAVVAHLSKDRRMLQSWTLGRGMERW